MNRKGSRKPLLASNATPNILASEKVHNSCRQCVVKLGRLGIIDHTRLVHYLMSGYAQQPTCKNLEEFSIDKSVQP